MRFFSERENDNILRKKTEKKLAAEAAQKERAIKKEEMQKNKEMKKRTPKVPKCKYYIHFLASTIICQF